MLDVVVRSLSFPALLGREKLHGLPRRIFLVLNGWPQVRGKYKKKGVGGEGSRAQKGLHMRKERLSRVLYVLGWCPCWFRYDRHSQWRAEVSAMKKGDR